MIAALIIFSTICSTFMMNFNFESQSKILLKNKISSLSKSKAMKISIQITEQNNEQSNFICIYYS